jgi:RNA polymerase sigma-70 factor, ECF subfamily
MIGTLSLFIESATTMTEPRSPHGVPAVPAANVSVEAESSLTLVRRAQGGDEIARNELCDRYLPRLRRWAHGRLPSSARGALDTVDLVQDTFIRVLDHLKDFEPRHAMGFQAYLRMTMLNRIRDELRKVQRRGVPVQLDPGKAASGPSPLEEAIGHETLEVYERALERLGDVDREAVIMRIELGCSYDEIAETLGKPSVGAAQMTVSRALVRLSQEMSRERR